MENTFWDEISVQLQQIGLDTATQVAQNASNKITGAGATADTKQQKQDPQVIQSNPWSKNLSLNDLSKMQIAGIGLPIIAAGALVLYFAMRK